jgi:hypothetical protein
MSDQYGLESNFKFAASNSSFSQMDRVIGLLEGIEKATKETAQVIASTSLGKDLIKSLNADGVKREGKDIQGAVKQITNSLSPLKSEFRALRAESRNIDFGELTDMRQFKQASSEIDRYIKKLKEIETQVSGSTPVDREFKASLQSQQRVAGDKVRMAKANRDAALASERLSFAQAIGGAGQGVVDTFSEPLAAAAELQKSLAGVKKLADDLTATGTQTLQNQVFNLSARLGVEDTKVSSIFEDLAGSGKKFGDEMGGVGSRIAEVEQILKNQQALDISSGVATQLDVTLGSIYKNLVSKDPNAIVELNARVASSVNELADKLSDVRISAEDVIPVMNVVMNTVGDSANFPVDQIAAYSAAIASLGTIEPEAAGSFFNRLSAKMSENTTAFAGALNMSSAEFEKKLNTDKLGVVTDLAAAYKNVQGGELQQGSFFASIGIGSVQDQKLLQGLSNQLDVLKSATVVSKAGFLGKEVHETIDATGKKVLSLGEDLKTLSIDKEVSNVLKTSAFQSQRFDTSMKALKDTLGSAIIEVITPLKSLASDVIGVFINLTQVAPGLTKVLASLTFALGALAVAAGTVGASLFAFQQAQAIATTAAIGMQHSLIPLTGFFKTSMDAFTGTFPWTNAFKQSTVMAEEFTVAATGAKGMVAGELRTAFIGLRAQVMMTSQAALGMARAFMFSPLGIVVGSILLLDQLLQRANPQVRLLGTLFSVFSSAAGFAFGVLEGFVGAFLKLLKVPAGAAGGLLASPFQAITQALEFAMESFRNWERSGKHIGESIFNIMATPFVSAASLTASAWDRTISFISGLLRPLADFAAYIGHFIQGSLSEASPGPSYRTRINWAFTAAAVGASMGLMRVSAMVVGAAIQKVMGAVAGWVVTAWRSAGTQISSIFAGFSLPEGMTDIAVEIANAWHNTFGTMTAGWLNFVTTFTSATPDFGGLAFAGMAAMKPLLAWGLPDIVSEKFDNIVAPKTQAPLPQVVPQVVEPRQQESISQQSQQLAPPQTETLWQEMWGNIVDISHQATSQIFDHLVDMSEQAGNRILVGITAVFGTGVVGFFTNILNTVNQAIQNASKSYEAFTAQSAGSSSVLGGVFVIIVELTKGIFNLSSAFMQMEAKVFDATIEGFNMLGFSALLASSMLMSLVTEPFEALKKLPLFGGYIEKVTSLFGLPNQKLLEKGASKYVEFLKVFENPGIGTALAKGLPGIVAVLMSMNIFETVTQAWSSVLIDWANNLPQKLFWLVGAFVGAFNFFSATDLIREDVDNLVGEIGSMFGDFFQELGNSAIKVQDFIRPIFEAIASVKVLSVPQFFADYMGFGDAVRPFIDFVHSLPILGIPIGEFIVVEAALSGIVDLLRSPSFAGFVGFLRGPLLGAVMAIGNVFFSVFRAIGVAVVSIPLLLIKTAISNSVKAGMALGSALLAPVTQSMIDVKAVVIDQMKLVFAGISGGAERFLAFLRTIPVIGNLIATVLEGTASGLGALFSLGMQALPEYLGVLTSQLNNVWSSVKGLIPIFAALGASLGVGAKYIINEAIKPLTQAIGFIFGNKFDELYIKTKGLQGITKGVNPLDVGFAWMDDAIVNTFDKLGAFSGDGDKKTAKNSFRLIRNSMMEKYKVFHGITKEVGAKAVEVSGQVGNAVGSATEEFFPISILGGKLNKVRENYLSAMQMLRRSKGYDTAFDLGKYREGFLMFKMVAPSVVQLIARAAFAWMTYYTVLDAIKPALLNTIDNFARSHKQLGIFANVIYVFTGSIRLLRLILVDSVNAVGAFSVGFFKAFQIIAPIAGQTAGLIAKGIGLIIKAVILGTKTVTTLLLLPVVAVTKVIQGILMGVRYFGEQIRNEFSYFGGLWQELFAARDRGDIVGGLWAFFRILLTAVRVGIGVTFLSMGRIIAGSIFLLGGMLIEKTKQAITLLVFNVIPYIIQTSQNIGAAFIQGIVFGVQNGIKNLIPAINSIGSLLRQHKEMAGALFAVFTLLGFVGIIVFQAIKNQLAARAALGVGVNALGSSMSGIAASASFAFLPWLAVLAGVGFLIWQLIDGFKELDGVIAALNQPVQWLRDGMTSISKTFSTGINTDGISFVVEKLIRVMPIVLGGIFLLGFAVKKHIFGGFMLIWDVVKGIANSLINVIRSAKSIPGSIMGIGTEGRILEGVHKTRAGLNLYRDPQSKDARENEFKLAKESALFLQKIREKSQAEIVTLAQQQKTDFGHMAKQVDVKKGGFFGIGAQTKKEWQLTGAGEEFQRKRLAETHEAKVGVFSNSTIKTIAKEVSPARLGMMGGDQLRSIFEKDRPDLAALGRALETVKVQNVAVMNVSRVNGMNSDEQKKNAGAIYYSRDKLAGLGVKNLDPNKNAYAAQELNFEQLRTAVKGVGASNVTSQTDYEKLSQQARNDLQRLMAYQVAAGTGKINTPQAKSVASVSYLGDQLNLNTRDTAALTNSNFLAFKDQVEAKVLDIKDSGHEALKGFNFDDMMDNLKSSKNAGEYKTRMKTQVEAMLKHQLANVANATDDIDPHLFTQASAELRNRASNTPDKISHGLKGILTDVMGGIGQAITNAAKKLPGHREGFSNEALREIDRKIAGAAPLADQRQQDSRRSRLEAMQRQLRSGNLNAETQGKVMQQMAELLQKDVYELTHPLMKPGQLNARLEQARTERAKLFDIARTGQNQAFKDWIGKFTPEQRTAILNQIKQGNFKGGALKTTEEVSYRDASGQQRTKINTVNNEAGLAQALGYDNIQMVEQALSTETILSSAKESWKTQLARIIGINNETNLYNRQIDTLRTSIDQRVSRQESGFAQREARRTAAAANREAGFVAQLNQAAMTRQQFITRLDVTQQKVFDNFLQTGKFQTEIPESKFAEMQNKLGFKNVDTFKNFQELLSRSENQGMAAYFQSALDDRSKFNGTEAYRNIRTADGRDVSQRDRLMEIMREAGETDLGRPAQMIETITRSLGNPNQDNQNAWRSISEYMRTGQSVTDLTVEQIAAIGRHMDLQGTDEQVAAQLRTIANQRSSGFGSISESIRTFLRNVETDAGTIEQFIDDRLTAMSSFSVFGQHPFQGMSDALRHVLFEPITALVKGTWAWMGNAIKELGSNLAGLKARGMGMLAALPGVRTFAQARQRRENDRGASLQTLSTKMGYANQEEFAQKFKDAMTVRGISDSRIQNRALQAILNSKQSRGVAQTLQTNRTQEIRDNSNKIGEALAETLGATSPEDIAKMLAPGGFTTRALAPLRNYLLKAVFPAIWDVASSPLKAIVRVLKNPQQAFNTVKSAASRVMDAISDFMVGTYSNIRKLFAATTAQLGRIPLFGKIWGAVSGFFGKIAAKVQGLVAPATTRQIRNLQTTRQSNERNLVQSRAGNFPAEQLPDPAEVQRLNNRIVTLSQVRAQAIARLNPFQKLLVQGTGTARAVAAAWSQTSQDISQRGWRGLVERAKRFGYLIQRNISEGSPGPSANTRQNWEHTQESVSQNMGEMAATAHVAGQQIQSDMQRTARRSAGFFGALHGAVAGAGRAGMAVGGAITAVGFAAQTASYSLVNMGMLDEASAAKLNKFLEIFTLVGAVGGLMAPVMGAIVSSVGAIGSAFALIFNPITLTMAAITGGLYLANEGLKRFAGIDLLDPLVTNIQEPLTGAITFIQEKVDQVFVWLMEKFGTQLSPILEPIGAAIQTIQGAWQGFVDWFVAMPLVQTAIDIGMGLINALNHNPTVQIPLAWEGAIENIKGMLFNLPFVGDLIASLMKDSLDPTKILGNLFQGFHTMLDQLEKSGLARFGGGKMLDGLRGFLGGFGKKKVESEAKTEIPVEAGVKLNYKEALDAAIRQADFDARSGSSTAQAASANLQYQLKTTGGQMDGNQLGAAYQGTGGEFLQRAITKENNRLFTEQGTGAKEKREAIQQELQTLNQKEVALQMEYVRAIEQVQVAATIPPPTNFIEKLLDGNNSVAKFTAQADAAAQAMIALQEQRSEIQKQAIANSVVFDVGTDQMLKNMGIDPDGLKVAVAEAKTTIAAGIKEVGLAVSDRWRYLERSGGGNLSLMTATDMQKVGGAFRILKGDVADFAQKAATSLQKMDWNGLKEASGDFWSNLKFGLGQVASGFAGAGLSTALFYVHLAPMAFVLGAVALAGLAIATNFLGLRSILMGMFRIFSGFTQVAVSSLMMVLNVIRGVVHAVSGIPNALRGDFSQLGEGLEIVWVGIKEGARGLFRGLSSIFGGGLEVLGGLFEGLRQTINIVFGPALLNSARESVTAIKQLFASAGETITAALKKPGNVLDGIANRFRKGKDQVADSPIGRTVGAIADVASGKAPNMDAARVAHDFDMRMRGQDPDAQLTAADRARLAQTQMENVLTQSLGIDASSRPLPTDMPRPSRSEGVLSSIDDELRAAQSGLGSMRDRSVSAADAANNALSSLGVALSSFAPALAAPLFMVGDLLNGFTGLSLALPQLGSLFPGVATAITGFTTALSAGSLTASTAIAGFGAAFSGVMAAISSAASIAWVAISGPMLPIFVLVGALLAGFVLFKTNFMGFGDIVSGVFSGIKDVLGSIWQTITEGISSIASMIGKIGGYLLEPLKPLLQLFGLDTGGDVAGQLQAAFVANAITALLRPIQAIGTVLKGVLWTVFAVIKGVFWLGGLLVRAILAPITLITNAIALIVRGFQALGVIVGNVLLAPFQFLKNVVQWIWDRLIQLPAFLGQVIASVPLIGPLLQNLGNSIFQSGVQTPVQQFASGGPVIGPGSGTSDSIPALLSNKEFVVSAGPAQENLGLLTALNAGHSVEVMPMPAPTRIPVAAMSRSQSAESTAAPMQMPPVQINVNLQGDVVLSGGNSTADAQEFLTKIEPHLQQAVWRMFRDWVDFNR